MTEVDICNRALAIIGEAPTVTAIDPADGSPHAAQCALWLPQARETVLDMHNWTFASKRVELAHVVLSVTNVNTTNNRITVSAAHGLATNDVVRVGATTTMPAPLEVDTDYYVIYVSSTVFELAEEADGTAINLTGAGSGTITVEKRSMRPGFSYAYAVPTDMQQPLAVVDAEDRDNDQGGEVYFNHLSGMSLPATVAPVVPLLDYAVRTPSYPYKIALNRANESVIYANVENADLIYQAYVTDTNQWPAGFGEVVMWQLAAYLAGSIKRSEQTANWCLQQMQRSLAKAAARDANASNMPLQSRYPWDMG